MQTTMKKLKTVMIFFCLMALSFNSCKKEVLSDKDTVQQHFLGRWPAKYRIRTVTDSFTTRIDTVFNNPVDTLIFETNGSYTRRNNAILVTGTYTIDEAGENITFSDTTSRTQKINYARNITIGLLVSDVTTGSGITKVRTVIEDQLAKR